MNRNPVGWFEIYVNDMERARKFYEAVFAVTLQNLEMPEMEMWSFAMSGDDLPGSSGALIRMEGMDAGGNDLFNSAVSVDDFAVLFWRGGSFCGLGFDGV